MEPTREQLTNLARQLAATAPDELDCDAVLHCVAGYLEAVQADEDLTPQLALVAQHLEICPSCLEEFRALISATETQ